MNRIKLVHTDSLSCEPILRKLPNGELVCVCQCGDVREPAPGNRVYFFHSKDDGETWSEKNSIYPEDGNAVYITEVSVYGSVISAYLTTHSGRFLDWKCIVMKSHDNGYTWEKAGEPPHFSGFTFIRGMIEAKNHNILIPYQHYPVTKEENDRVAHSDLEDKTVWATKTPYVEDGVLLSIDNGKTFARFPASKMNMEDGWIWSEPTIVELSDGTITMLLRKCRSGWLWRTDSKDGGKTWNEVYNTNIPNPSNKAKLIKLANNRIALIHTPNNEGMEKGTWAKRFPLQIWISDDDMKTWGYKKTITDFPGNYSYSDGFYENGHIKFTIEHNRHDILFIDHTIES